MHLLSLYSLLIWEANTLLHVLFLTQRRIRLCLKWIQLECLNTVHIFLRTGADPFFAPILIANIFLAFVEYVKKIRLSEEFDGTLNQESISYTFFQLVFFIEIFLLFSERICFKRISHLLSEDLVTFRGLLSRFSLIYGSNTCILLDK